MASFSVIIASESAAFETGRGSWSVVSAAGGYAQLAAVLAGFVFVALTIAITTPSHSTDSTQHQKSTTLLATAFVALLIGALFFVDISGELNDDRAVFLSVVASSVLGLGALLLMAGTAWLFKERGLAVDAQRNFHLLAVLLLPLAATFVALPTDSVLERWSEDAYTYQFSLAAALLGAGLFGVGFLALPKLSRPPTWWIRGVSVASIVFLFLTSALMVWLIGSEELKDAPDLAIRSEGQLLNLWEFRALVFVLSPLYLLLFAAVALVVPWSRWFRQPDS
jgi:hypothetical protein